MKKSIQPNWHHDAMVTCTCGESFVTGATVKDLQVDICSKCHPFFTGEVRFVDRQGRVDKFLQKQKKAEALRNNKSGADKENDEKISKQQDPKSYQEILRQQRTAIKQSAQKKASEEDTAQKAA